MANEDFISVSLPWGQLGELERGQLYEQARRLGQRYDDRPNVSGVFFNIAVAALVVRLRVGDGEGRILNVVSKDPTAPDSHLRDDIGTAMAFIKTLHDDPGTLPGVKAAWAKVLEDLRWERDRVVDEWRK
jgi:hypothetical protein